MTDISWTDTRFNYRTRETDGTVGIANTSKPDLAARLTVMREAPQTNASSSEFVARSHGYSARVKGAFFLSVFFLVAGIGFGVISTISQSRPIGLIAPFLVTVGGVLMLSWMQRAQRERSGRN
jgi:hypothetical protein